MDGQLVCTAPEADTCIRAESGHRASLPMARIARLLRPVYQGSSLGQCRTVPRLVTRERHVPRREKRTFHPKRRS